MFFGIVLTTCTLLNKTLHIKKIFQYSDSKYLICNKNQVSLRPHLSICLNCCIINHKPQSFFRHFSLFKLFEYHRVNLNLIETEA